VRFRRRAKAVPGLSVGRSLRRRGAVVVLPTLFTLGNLVCGFASLHYAAKGTVPSGLIASNYAVAGYLIFAGMFFDLFDGFVARLTRSASNFGAELDSLADMVSFGVAPAFLALRLVSELLTPPNASPDHLRPYEFLGPNADDTVGKLFWAVGALYVVCTALRLARFNVFNKHDEAAHVAFRGLPSPGAAAVVASTIIFYESLHYSQHLLLPFRDTAVNHWFDNLFPYTLPALLLTSALLMVSRFTYAHLINRFLRGRKKFGYLVGIVLFLMLLLLAPQVTALLFIYVYALSAPVMALFRFLSPRRAAGAAGTPALREATPGQAPDRSRSI
jgi:CDP-diacylglycerol--serine O-phosphatidyltransferase